MSEGHDKSAVLKNLVNVFRRLHRIFAHAWFQHRGVFWTVEGQTGLYVFFKTVCDLYELLPAENYKLPPEAEGLESAPSEKDEKKQIVTAIAKPPSRQSEGGDHDDDRHNTHARKSSNTARHSSRPSTGRAVTTVIEEREDENSDVANKLKAMHLAPPETVEEESEVEVPVIVEGEMIEKPVELPQPSDAPAYEVKIDVQEDVAVEPDNFEEGEFAGGDAPPILKHEKVGSPVEPDVSETSPEESAAQQEESEAPDTAAEATEGSLETQAPTAGTSADGTAEEDQPPKPEESEDANNPESASDQASSSTG